MSANVDAIRAVYARWAMGDFNTVDIFDPDVRTIWADEMPDVAETRGVAGLAAATRNLIEGFERVTFVADSFSEDGDRVLVLLRVLGRHHGGDAALEWKVAHLWTMREGKAVVVQGWTNQEQGIRESGIVPV